jgi:formylglycine-generating enzyme required for sulfatase activity
LSEKEELPPYYKLMRIKRKSNGMIERADVDVIGGCGYRLPTEAEWEYCCRAGSISPWCFGEQVVDVGQYAWFFDNSHMETHPVGERKPNAWGLYDMHGNVMEWCFDYYEEFYYQRCTEEENPPGPEEGSTRVIRGGAWQFGAEATRCPYRNSYNPETASSVIGLRIMRDLEEEQTVTTETPAEVTTLAAPVTQQAPAT